MTDVSVKAGGYPADEEFIFLKNYTCPVCGKEVKNPTVKSSKARLVGSEIFQYSNADTEAADTDKDLSRL